MRKLYFPIILFYLLLVNNQLLAQCSLYSVNISSNPNTKLLNCKVTDIVLTAEAQGPAAIKELINYKWGFKPENEAETIVSTTYTYTASKAGTYTVYAEIKYIDDNGDTMRCEPSNAVTITNEDVVRPTITAFAVPASICENSTSNLVASGAVKYTWQSKLKAEDKFEGSQIPVTPAQTTTYTVTGEADNGCKTMLDVEVVVNPKPDGSITGTTTICQNATPPPIKFKWLSGKKPLLFTYNVINGINTGPTLKVQVDDDEVSIDAPTRMIGISNYNLKSVTDDNGCIITKSETAIVTVAETGLLISDKTASVCDSSVFEYKAVSSSDITKTSFSWKRPVRDNNKENSGTTSNIKDTLYNHTTNPIVVTYYFDISTGSDCITHDSVKVTVNPKPVIDLVADTTICNGTFLRQGIPFKSTGFPDASFSWTNDNLPIGLDIYGIGPIPPFIATNNDTTRRDTANIKIAVKSSTSGCLGIEKHFRIIVSPAAIFTSPKTRSVCDSTLFTYKGIISPAATSYSWTRLPVEGIAVDKINNKGKSAETDSVSEYLDNTTSQPLVVPYIFTLSAGFGCRIEDTVKVTVNPTPVIDPISIKPYCNRDFVTGGISFKSASPDSSFTWRIDEPNIGLLTTSGSGSIPPFIAMNTSNKVITTTITVAIKASSNQCPGPNRPFIVTVRPAPILVDPKTFIICDSSLFEEKVKSSAVGTTFNWKRPTIPELSNDSAMGTNEFISERLNNITSKTAVASYIFTLSIDTGCVTHDTLNVTVNPTPVITPLNNLTFCNGEAVRAIKFSSATDSVSFKWTSDLTVGFGLNGRDSIPTFTATNLDTAVIVAKISVAGTVGNNNQCKGQDTTFTITVKPSPPKPNFTSLSRYSDNDTLQLCNGSENINFNVTTPAKGVTYNWTSTASRQTVLIRDANDTNTVISFYDQGTNTIKVTATKKVATDTVGCTNTVSQIVKIENLTSGIDKRKIFKMQPGNLLIYPNNSLAGYQWGYDAIFHTSPDSSFGPPVPIAGQVYQFFIPGSKFLNGDSLDETKYLYWLLLTNQGCSTRVYYNGPYANRVMETVPADSTIRLQLFPNPNKGDFEIALKGNIYGNIKAEIHNAMGQVVYTKNFVKTAPDVNEKLRTGNLPGGIYFLILYSSDMKKVSSRFVIQR